MKRRFMVLSMAVLCVFMLTMAAYGQVQLVDGFEAEQPFSAEESFRYAVASTDWASQGERSVRAVHRVIAEPQKGFLKKLGEVNWRNYDFFQIDFYNPHDVPVELAMYVMVGSDWDWNETTTVVADPGENLGVTFELKEDIWKNAATNWEHATAPDLSQIVGYGIIVYPTEEGIPEGSVYFDNFRLGTRDAKAAASPVVTATASLSSPIAFRPGDWKIGVGDGKLSFENGTIHITDYEGWKLLQMGANTTGALDLRGYTGVQFEAKTSEATAIEFAIQLRDWAFQVVHRQEIAPEDGWVTMNVDLTGYDLSVVNALCIQQGAPADFSLRNIFPTPMPERAVAYDAESASIVSSPIKLSGTIDLELTARRVEVVKSVSPIGLNADDWKLQEDAEANLEFGENSLHVTDYPGWKRIERKKQIDLSDYTGIQFEVKVAAHTNFQFIMQPANWAWTQLFTENIAPEDGWRTIKVDLSGHDLVGVNALIFQAGAVEFWIRNLMPIPLEAESEHYMEVEHDYGVELKLDYRISDDWTASMISTLAQESLEIGLLEVKGTAGNLGIRAFANGTGANLGDPMGVVKGEKYHKDKTAGLDLRSPLHTGFAHVLLSIPTKDRTGALLAGEVEIPVEDETVVQVLAAREWPTVGPDPEENLEKPVDSVVSAVVNTVLDNGLKLTGQVAISGHDGLGYYAKAVFGKLEGGILHAPAGLWTHRGDFDAQDGYGKYYLQGNHNFTDTINAGFYFNQWYNHKEGDAKYKNWFGKVYADWKINPKVTLNTVFEQKWQLNNATKKYDKLEESKLIAKSKIALAEDLNGDIISIFGNEDNRHLRVPGIVGRLTYTGVTNWKLIGELGVSKASQKAEFERNLHLKAIYSFGGGSIGIGFGKPTLNDDDDKFINRSTAKHYYSAEFTYSF